MAVQALFLPRTEPRARFSRRAETPVRAHGECPWTGATSGPHKGCGRPEETGWALRRGGKGMGFAITWASVGIRLCHLTSFGGTSSWMYGVTVILTMAAVIMTADITTVLGT